MRNINNNMAVLITGMSIGIGLFIPASGAFEDLSVGGKAAGMGSAYVALALGPEAVYSNPAGPAQSDRPALCLFVSRPFGLRELSHETVSGLIWTRLGSVSLSYQTFGNDQYRENSYALGWGNRWKNRLFYGLLVKIARLQINRYGSSSVFMADVGFLYKMGERISWGVASTNISQERLGHSNDPLPQITRVGLCCIPLPGITLSAELDKDVRFPVEYRCGMEICPIAALLIRCGLSRNPSTFSIGTGLMKNLCSFDYVLTIHPVLGVTHQGSISIDWNPHSAKPLRVR